MKDELGWVGQGGLRGHLAGKRKKGHGKSKGPRGRSQNHPFHFQGGGSVKFDYSQLLEYKKRGQLFGGSTNDLGGA